MSYARRSTRRSRCGRLKGNRKLRSLAYGHSRFFRWPGLSAVCALFSLVSPTRYTALAMTLFAIGAIGVLVHASVDNENPLRH